MRVVVPTPVAGSGTVRVLARRELPARHLLQERSALDPLAAVRV